MYENALERPVNVLAGMSVRLCAVRKFISDTRSSTDSKINHVTLASTLNSLDDDLTTWSSNLRREYDYDTAPSSRPSKGTNRDHYHIYASHWIAIVWNKYRSMRILTLETLIGVLQRPATGFDTILAGRNDRWLT